MQMKWEIKIGFYPLEPNYQVLRNALVYLQKKGFVTVDKRLGHRHYNYKITSEGRKYFEEHYIPLKLIEQNRIKPSIQGGKLHE